MAQEPTDIHRQLKNENKNEKAMKKIKKIQESWNKRNAKKLIIAQEPTTLPSSYLDEKQRKIHHTHKMRKSKDSTKRVIPSKVDVEIQRKFKDLADFIEKTIK